MNKGNTNIDLESKIRVVEGARLELEKTDVGYDVNVATGKKGKDYCKERHSEYSIEEIEDHYLVRYHRTPGSWTITVKHSEQEAENFIEKRFEKLKNNLKYFNPTNSAEAYVNSLSH